MKFDILELQNYIEEKRLTWGKKLENFLLANLLAAKNVLNKFLNKKSSAFFGSFLIVIASIFLQSTKDISHNSAAILDIAKVTQNLILLGANLINYSANQLTINPIFIAFIGYNFLGILSLFFSYKILQKSSIAKEYPISNLIIFAFGCGFFLSPITLPFNEIINKGNYFLALFFPLISFQLAEKKQLKKTDKFLIGLISITLFGLLFFQDLPSIFKVKQNILLLIKQDLFSIFLLIFLCFFLSKKFHFLKALYISSLAMVLITLVSGDRMALYSSALPALFTTTYLILKKHYIDFKKDLIFLLIILLIPCFDKKNIFAIALDLTAFWWIFVLILNFKWRKKIPKNDKIYKKFLAKIFLPHSALSWTLFASLALITIYITIFGENLANLLWIIFAIIFTLFIKFSQKIHEKIYVTTKFSRLYLASISLVISYFVSLYYEAFFEKNRFTSPNYANNQIVRNIKNYSDQKDDITISSNNIALLYPIKNYLPNYMDDQISTDNKLIFIDRSNKCHIGDLELALRDKYFRKDFTKNYRFLNRIIEVVEIEKKVNFFNENLDLKIEKKPKIIINDIEIYIKK